MWPPTPGAPGALRDRMEVWMLSLSMRERDISTLHARLPAPETPLIGDSLSAVR